MNDSILSAIFTSIEGFSLCLIYLSIFNKDVFKLKSKVIIIIVIYEIFIMISIKYLIPIAFFSICMMPIIYSLTFKINYKKSFVAVLLSFDFITFVQFIFYFITYIFSKNDIKNNLLIFVFQNIHLLFSILAYNEIVVLQNLFNKITTRNNKFRILFWLLNITVALIVIIYNIKSYIFNNYLYSFAVTIFSIVTITMLLLDNQLMLESNLAKLINEKKEILK